MPTVWSDEKRAFIEIDGHDPGPAGDVTRADYRLLTEAEAASMRRIKSMGNEFIKALHEIGGSPPEIGRQNTRELQIAQTKVEEAVMWAVKHITR